MLKKLNQKILFLLLIIILQFVLVQIGKSSHSFLQLYSTSFYPKYNQSLIQFSSRFNFSIGELFYLIFFIGLISIVLKTIRFKVYNDRINWRKTLINLLVICNVFYFLFNISWSFNYSKKSFTNDFYLESLSIDELKYMAENELALAKLYREKSLEDENGVFKLKLSEQDLEKEIIKNQFSLYGLPFLQSQYFVELENIKPSIISEGLSYLGVLGYYNPFTAEANYNQKSTQLDRPFTIAHELAHQIGYAPENEANFIAYIIADQSDNDDLKYAAHYKTLMNVLRQIIQVDPEFVKNKIDNFSDKMQRDRENEIAHAQKYLGLANDAFSNLNDTFLKANNQEGISSYSKYTLYVGAYYRWKLRE